MQNLFPRFLFALSSLLAIGFVLPAVVHAAQLGDPGVAFNTPVAVANLDPAAFAEWVDGAEKPVVSLSKTGALQWVVFTSTTNAGSSGVTFGDSKTPGPRHLRIGFHAAVPVGSVMVKGGGRLSLSLIHI